MKGGSYIKNKETGKRELVHRTKSLDEAKADEATKKAGSKSTKKASPKSSKKEG